MKSTFLNLMACFLLISMAASCGNKGGGSSGSKSKDPYKYNPILTGGNQVGEAGYNQLVAWLNSADTASGMRAFYVKKTGSMSGWSESELCQMFGINMPYCTKPTLCIESVGSEVKLGVTLFDNLRPQGCALNGTTYSKAGDVALREAVLGRSGRVVLKDRTIQSGNIFIVYYSLYQGSTQVSGAAKINTSLPAALNPEILEENMQRTKIKFTAY